MFEMFRLPIFIRPISYDLELTPNITTLAVRGIIKLIFQVRFPLPTSQNTDTQMFGTGSKSLITKFLSNKVPNNKVPNNKIPK